MPSSISRPKATSIVRSMDRANSSHTNIVGTFTLLQEALRYWRGARSPTRRAAFRLLHVSTDEVYGTLGAEGLFTETHALCAELALLGQQGVVRSSGPGMARDLWTADPRHQLLQQLRPLSFSGKADPAHDHPAASPSRNCRSMATACNMRDWLYRRGSRPRARARACAWPGRRNLQCRRPQRAHQHPCGAHDLRSARSPGAVAGGARQRLISFVADRPGHDRRYAIDPTQDRAANWAGAPRRHSRPASKRRSAGSSTTAPGGRTFSTAAIRRAASV